MQTTFDAVWYDPKKCEAKAIAAGWDPKSGDGFLDIYMPEEDPNGHENKTFRTLDEAVAYVKKIVADGNDFWGQARINKYEVGGPRCKYCTCRGTKLVHTYIVEADGVVEDHAENDCLDDDD